MKFIACDSCGALLDSTTMSAGAPLLCAKCKASAPIQQASEAGSGTHQAQTGVPPAQTPVQPEQVSIAVQVASPESAMHPAARALYARSQTHHPMPDAQAFRTPYGDGTRASEPLPNDMQAPRRMPVLRSTAVCALLYLVTLGLYCVYWVWTIHEELPSRREDPSGFQAILHIYLIPFLLCVLGFIILVVISMVSRPSIEVAVEESTLVASLLLLGFWVPLLVAMLYSLISRARYFARLSQRINELIRAKEGEHAPRASTELIVVAQVLWPFFFLGAWVCELIWWINVQDAANRLAGPMHRA